MKVHYADLERGNESNPNDEWGTTYCGLEYYESPVTNKHERVDCKKCLKIIEKNGVIAKQDYENEQNH